MKQKLAKSTHKWKLKKDATFGKIRIRLGKYYNINPYNIEIWIRSKLGKNKTKQWVYDLQDRGLSEDSIEDRRLLTDAFQRQYMFVKFEIVAYDIRNFDKMISNSKMSPQPKNNVISELAALFDFDFYTPNDNMFDTKPTLRMKIIHKKNWKAKEIISKILKYCINNPLYGYVYFESILKYTNDKFSMQMLTQLKPHQFVLCEKQTGKAARAPKTWRVNQIYKMPTNYSPILHTHFELLFLNSNDPMTGPSLFKSLWVCFQSEKHKSNNNICCRILLQKDDTFLDIIKKQICKHLATIDAKHILKLLSPLWNKNLIDMIHFELSGYVGKLTFDLNIYDIITNKSRLLIQLPQTQTNEVKLFKTSSELTLNSMRTIANHCEYYKYNVSHILDIWKIRTINNAIDWMNKGILYNINAIDYHSIVAKILILIFQIYFYRFIENPKNSFLGKSLTLPNVYLSAQLYELSILKLHNMLLTETSCTNIDFAGRFLYGWFSSQISMSNNIFHFQLWLLKHKRASEILSVTVTMEFSDCAIFFKAETVVNLAQKLLTSSEIVNNPKMIKYCMNQLWNSLNDIVMINWDEHSQLCNFFNMGKESCEINQIIKAIQYCYQLMKWNLNDCKKKLQKLIYRINNEKLRLRLIKICNEKKPLNIMKYKVKKDLNYVKYDIDQSNWFETQSKIVWFKQMVRGIKCEWCNKQKKKLRICKGCRNIWYCSRQHQKLDWNFNHRSVCYN
eukprot:312157_1